MFKKSLLFALAGVAALAIGANGASAAGKIKIGFLPGVVDPFYQVMQLGVEAGRQGPRHRGRHADPADLGRRGADADPRRA